MTEKNSLYAIVGLGATGMSCARFLSRQGIPFAVTDSRANPPQADIFEKIFPGVPLSLGQLDEALLDQADQIILSPGVSLKEGAIARQLAQGKRVVGDVELFAQVVKQPVIAITGTNAKSTVTTLVGDMLSVAGYKTGVGGNLGYPVLDMLQEQYDVYVLELSSFQLETIHSLEPAVASILNISPDHLDRHGHFDHYVAAKQHIYLNAAKAVSNYDDPLTQAREVEQQYYFSLEHQDSDIFSLIEKEGRQYLGFAGKALLDVAELPIRGKHFQINALAALAIGYAFGLSMNAMLKAIKDFRGLPHRCELVRELNSIMFYNDSKGTNVGATLAALNGLGQAQANIVLIAGGVGKGADFSPLLRPIQQFVKHVVLIGEAADLIGDLLVDAVPVSYADSMDEAVKIAYQNAGSEDIVLLSPACASFDMFNNFEHRGQVFTQVVKQLHGD